MSNRREFIKAGALGGALMATGLPITSEAAGESTGVEPVDILVLGGTGFIGPHMVREALRRGHSVTLFNRGRTNSALFPDLETIKGDRADDLEGLRDRRWDAVVDNSGYMPDHVGASAGLLANSVDHYLFVSSISVYADFAQPNDEESPVATLIGDGKEFSWEDYGALKALCEQRAAAEMGSDRLTVLRPTYICGPGDHTDRFTYWPVRTKQGGEMLWPGTPGDTIQIIDVRDLAIFVVDCLEQRVAGTYNTVTPKGSCTMGDLLADSQAVTAADVDAVWIDEEFLSSQSAPPLPIWHPRAGQSAEASNVSGERARAAGLRNRPMRETARDLMTWWDTLPEERVTTNARFSMTPEKEAELIAAWKAR